MKKRGNKPNNFKGKENIIPPPNNNINLDDSDI